MEEVKNSNAPKTLLQRMNEIELLSPHVDISFPPEEKTFVLRIQRWSSEESGNAQGEARRKVNSVGYANPEIRASEMQEVLSIEYYKLAKKHLIGWTSDAMEYNPANREKFFTALSPVEQVMLGILAAAMLIQDEKNAGKKFPPALSTQSESV